MMFKNLTRPITQKEINELLRTKPDFKKYPSEKCLAEPRKLQDHHLFRMIGGNPSMIVILAPLLTDTERTLDLPALY